MTPWCRSLRPLLGFPSLDYSDHSPLTTRSPNFSRTISRFGLQTCFPLLPRDFAVRPPEKIVYTGGTHCILCHFDDGDLRATTRSTPPILCSNGVPGVETNGICCEAQCETCGGSGCDQRPGGKVGAVRWFMLSSLVLETRNQSIK